MIDSHNEIYKTVAINIAGSQPTQATDNDLWHQWNLLEVGTKVLRKYMMSSERQGGKLNYRGISLYEVITANTNGNYSIWEEKWKVLAKQVPTCQVEMADKHSTWSSTIPTIEPSHSWAAT